jgi:hypothetical protein
MKAFGAFGRVKNPRVETKRITDFRSVVFFGLRFNITTRLNFELREDFAMRRIFSA